MLTLPELSGILADHYTVEELCDMLGISARQLIEMTEEIIELRQYELLRRVQEDLGYACDDS